MMQHEFWGHRVSDDQIDRIEETAFRLLEEVGLAVHHQQATERLHGIGCRIEQGRVFIPYDVVQWAVGRIVPYTTFRSADGTQELGLGNTPRFHNTGYIPFVLDLNTGQRRLATSQDCVDASRLLDALPNVDIALPLFAPQDVPGPLRHIVAQEIHLRHCRGISNTAGADRHEDVRFIVRLAAACCGGMDAFRARPTLLMGTGIVSPMTVPRNNAAAIIEAAELGAAILAGSSPSLGATSPITLPATVALQHAEVLACIVLVASVRVGVPYAYLSRIGPIDLRTGGSQWGGPELGTSGALAAHLGHRLGLPVNVYGLSSASGKLDPQLAYEKLANTLVPMLGGAEMVSGVGSMESLLTGGLQVAVMDDEMIGLARQILRQTQVSDETLAFDVMREVIADNGTFLGHLHTVRHMRSGALWIPGVSDWSVGSTGDPHSGVVARAKAQVHEILSSHKVPPLPDDVSRELDGIMEEARRTLIRE